MIRLDTLARELGCTLSDIDDLKVITAPARAERVIPVEAAGLIRVEWSKRTGIDYTDNRLIRDVTLEHRVSSVHAGTVRGVTVLNCECGLVLRSHSEYPKVALRRLWKSHAIHVSTHLMSIGYGQ